jgi:hypothetical protein
MSDLGQRAFEHVRALAHDIGPRPAGSAAEGRAFDYIAGQLRQWGYAPETLPARFAPLPRFFPLYSLGALALILAAWDVRRWPLAAIALPVFLIALPQLAREIIHRRPRAQSTQNLIAYTAAASPRTLFFCAHVDSARATIFNHPALRWLQYYTVFIALRVALAAAALGLLHWAGFTVPAVFDVALRWLSLVLGGWWLFSELANQLMSGGRYAPGAHDNASGVGVVLALAEALAAQPLPNARVGFLFTGAEETGLHGAESFVEANAAQAGRAIVNLDMVGAGSRLRFVTGDGTFIPRRTDAGLQQLIQHASPEARGLWYTLRGGDYLPFLRRGWRVASLQTSGALPAELAYHSMADALEVIDPAALGRTAEVALTVAKKFS